jgi:hypothetical protein
VYALVLDGLRKLMQGSESASYFGATALLFILISTNSMSAYLAYCAFSRSPPADLTGLMTPDKAMLAIAGMYVHYWLIGSEKRLPPRVAEASAHYPWLARHRIGLALALVAWSGASFVLSLLMGRQ